MEAETEIENIMNDIVRPKNWRELEKLSPKDIQKFLPNMVETAVTYHDFAICERIIKKLNRGFAWDENFIVKVEILLVRFSLLGIKFRLNTRAKLCPALFVLLLSLDPNFSSKSVFKTASAQFFGVVSQIRYSDFKGKCVIAKDSAFILRDHKFLVLGLLERCESTFEFNEVRKILKNELGAKDLPSIAPKYFRRISKK